MKSQWRRHNGRWVEVRTRFSRRTLERLKGIGAGAIMLVCLGWAGYGDMQVAKNTAALPPISSPAVSSEPEAVLVPPEPPALVLEAPIEPEPVSTGTVREVSAYTSEVGQTDATPCISASGMNICHLYAEGTNVCATNAFPLGTLLEVEGLGTCVVEDRMNSRYRNRVDWYFGYDTQHALEFGVQKLHVTSK